MSRRVNGEGSAWKLPTGRWQGRMILGGKPHYRRGASKREVLTKLKALADEFERSKLTGETLLADWLTGWLDRRRVRVHDGTLKPRSLEADDRNVRLHIAPLLGGRPLNALTVPEISRWHTTLRRSGLSQSSADQTHRTLHNALAEAQGHGLITLNPAGKSSRPPRQPNPQQRPILQPDQAEALVTAASVSGVRLDSGTARVLLQVVEGLRQGEALGLQWNDLDLDGGTLTISRTLSRPSFRHGLQCKDKASHTPGRCPARIAGPVTGTPKSLRGRRTVPLSPMTTAALREQRRAIAARKLIMGTTWPSVDDWVFPGEMGQPPEIRGDARRWKSLVSTTLGDDAPTGTHAGRRHAATRWAMDPTVPVAAAMAAFGWSREPMLDHYAQPGTIAGVAAVNSVWAGGINPNSVTTHAGQAGLA